jgi:hypothetical protein
LKFLFEFEPFVEPILVNSNVEWVPILAGKNRAISKNRTGIGSDFQNPKQKTQFQAFWKVFRNPSLLVGYSDNLKKKKGKGCLIWACFSSLLDEL